MPTMTLRQFTEEFSFAQAREAALITLLATRGAIRLPGESLDDAIRRTDAKPSDISAALRRMVG